MKNFDDIRPYHDTEVRPALDRVLNDPEFKAVISRYNYPSLAKLIPTLLGNVIAWYIRRQTKNINSVTDIRNVVDGIMTRMIKRTTEGVTSSGIEKLSKDRAYLFISNHRDIAMDPALIDWVLFHQGHTTPRLAIGDNLLTKPFASDIMRLNKSFVVNRSATGNKEKYKALKHLSEYIQFSITQENANIWIAQRQGRAKDGIDQTETALMKMLGLCKPKKVEFVDHIRTLRIVPVSISYEWDPCDAAKANERFLIQHEGTYEKGEQEDIQNLAQGITGIKGHVHLAFGDELTGEYRDAKELSQEIDRQIIDNYLLQPSNYFAYKHLYGEWPSIAVQEEKTPFPEQLFKKEALLFAKRMHSIDPQHHHLVQEMYANPVVSKQQLTEESE